MPWARFSDDFYDHPKVLALPARNRNACVGLLVRSVSWSNRYLTDGVVPAAQLRHLGATTAHLAALFQVGLFDRLIDGIAVHDFLDYNPSKGSVMADRKVARERMERVRARRVRPNTPSAETSADRNGSGEHDAPSVPMFGRTSLYPDPTRPDPTNRAGGGGLDRSSEPRARGLTGPAAPATVSEERER